MPIDNCTHTFEELAASILPSYFAYLEEALQSPIPAERLVGFKSATREALTRLSRSVDFPGYYVFLDGTKPVYVGISAL
jgi:hypothetical protein